MIGVKTIIDREQADNLLIAKEVKSAQVDCAPPCGFQKKDFASWQSFASNESMHHLDNKSLDLDNEDSLLVPADLAKSKFSSHTSESDESASEKRDEVQEIRNRSRNEDRSVQLWRSALLFLILVIGATVSGLTFHFLQKEENKAFNLAVRIILITNYTQLYMTSLCPHHFKSRFFTVRSVL